jgi:DNA primase
MARYGDNAIDEVRQRADIVEIIGAHVRLRRTGRNFVGLCPFHNEKTPSFSVNAERGFYHCFGCGAGGTVFNFMMKIEGLSFPEAIRSLATRYGVSLPEQKNDGPGAAERDALTRANQTAAEFYAHVLWNTHDGELAREYLKERGITTETARAFMLGFSPARPASLAKALEKRGLTEAGIKAGVVKRDGLGLHDAFRARVMFPIRDAQGKVIAFGGRVLDARMPKYLNSPESPAYSKTRTLYGLHEARQAIASQDRVIIVEGYFDVIALWQAGFRETVASCGTSLTVEQLRLLSRYTKNVFACFDGDDAGRKASLRALEIFLQAGLLGRGIFIPTGFDPDTLVRERGAAFLEALIGASELLVDYFLKEQAREAKGSLAGRARAAEKVADLLKLVANPFEFDLLARKAAELLGVGEDTLRKAARGISRSVRGERRIEMVKAPARLDATTEAELGLVAIALLHPAMREEIRQSCAPEFFSDAALANIFAEVCALGEAAAGFEEFISERLSEEQQGRIAELAVGPLVDDPASARKLADDYILALSRRQTRREVDQLRRAATSASGPENSSDDAVASVQAVIELKKRDERERRNAS